MNRFIKKIIWLIIAVPLIYLAFTWKKIPEKVVTHFDIHGNQDKYGNKTQIWIMAGIIASMSVLIYFLLVNIYKLDPKKHAAENKDRLVRIAFAVVVFLSVISCTVIHASASGGVQFNIRFVFITMGIFWAIIGNYMYNIKPNYFAGFRLPWTLENEENWRKTHHVGGRSWFIGGLLLAVTCIFLPKNILITFFMAFTVLMVFIPIVYSYRFYKKHKSQIQ